MEIPYELIVKHLQRQTSPEEEVIVEDWLLKDDNKALYAEFRKEWKFINDPVIMPDKTKIWQNIEKQTINKKKNINLRKFLPIAAASVITMLITFSVFYFMYPNIQLPDKQFTSVITNENEKTLVELADNSRVWLNSNTTFSFSTLYGINDRETVLDSGELFVNVMPGDKKFIVNAGTIRVEVLGTSFNISKEGATGLTKITLKNGKLAVISQKSEQKLFELTPTQSVVINQDLSYTSGTKNVDNINIWTNERLEMYNEPLENIIDKLKIWYNLDISVSGLDMKKRYTFVLQKETPEEFLNLFSAITPIDYYITGRLITIKALSAK